jgi:hypothetical protein
MTKTRVIRETGRGRWAVIVDNWDLGEVLTFGIRHSVTAFGESYVVDNGVDEIAARTTLDDALVFIEMASEA